MRQHTKNTEAKERSWLSDYGLLLDVMVVSERDAGHGYPVMGDGDGQSSGLASHAADRNPTASSLPGRPSVLMHLHAHRSAIDNLTALPLDDHTRAAADISATGQSIIFSN